MTKGQLLGAVAAWARSKGIPRPTSKQAMQALVGQFLTEQPQWYEVAGDAPTHLTWNGVQTHIVDPLRGDPDDFDELVAQRQQAMVEAGGDDLAAHAIMQGVARNSLAQEAPFTRDNPPTATNALLGGQCTIQAGQDPVEIARWSGNDAETTNITITLGQFQLASTRQSDFHKPIQARPYAIVQWGTRGLSMKAFVDAMAGTQFTIGASYVSLSMAMQPLQDYPSNTAVAVPLLLSGMLSFRTIERQTPLTYTYYNDNFVTSVPNIPVPAFAKTFTLYWDEGGAGTVDISMEDVGNTLVATAKGLSSDAAQAKTILIPDNVTKLAPSNIVGVGGHVQVIFGLNL